MEKKTEKCRVVSFFNHKGGSGKTSSVTNFAYCLSDMGYKILVIDFDGQGNTSYNLGCLDYKQRNNTIIDLLQMVARNISLPKREDYIISGYNNIDLICCNRIFSSFEAFCNSTSGGEFLFKNFINKAELKNDYDFIIIDNNPDDKKNFVNSSIAANDIIVPLTPSLFDVQGLTDVVSAINEIIENPFLSVDEINLDGVLITQNNPRTLLSKETLEFCNNYKEQFYTYKTYIPIAEAVKLAQEKGSCVCRENKKHKASEAYYNFTKEYLIRKGYMEGDNLNE